MLIISLVLGVAVIVSLILLILQRTGLESITINPTFADTELDVNMDYIISINTDPSGVKTKKFSYESDSSAVTFESKDDGTAVLHTMGEGAVTVYVKKGKIESNKLTFQIVDKAAQAAAEAAAAQAQAEAEAQAQAAAEEAAAAEAEAAAAQVTYIKCIKNDVNIRSNASTDGDVLGKAKLGDTFEVINNDGAWTEFKYGDKSGFMRNDMIEVLPEGDTPEVTAPSATEEKKEEAKAEEKKEEVKAEEKKEEKPAELTAEEKLQKDLEAKQKEVEEEAKKLLEQQQQQQQQQQQLAAMGTVINCKDGKCMVTKSQLDKIHATWDFAGDAVEMAGHHSIGELEAVIGTVTRL